MDSANYYLQQAQKGFKELNNHRFIAQNLNLLGEVQLQSKHYDTALKYVDSSLTLANENDLKFLLPSNYALLSRIYSNMGNPEKAKEYSDLAHANRPREIDLNQSSISTLN
ncbi:MAG TPA: hypothetical protein VKZ97_10055 [Flavobacteriaceae bacterium]|nr:hypothetical protein [Flavobacteriaceae bacterium]